MESRSLLPACVAAVGKTLAQPPARGFLLVTAVLPEY